MIEVQNKHAPADALQAGAYTIGGQKEGVKRIVVLNALPISIVLDAAREQNERIVDVMLELFDSFQEFVLRLDEIRDLEGEIACVSYVRHKATKEVISKYIKCEDAKEQNYVYSRYDYIFIVALKAPVRGADVQSVAEDDLAVIELVQIW